MGCVRALAASRPFGGHASPLDELTARPVFGLSSYVLAGPGGYTQTEDGAGEAAGNGSSAAASKPMAAARSRNSRYMYTTGPLCLVAHGGNWHQGPKSLGNQALRAGKTRRKLFSSAFGAGHCSISAAAGFPAPSIRHAPDGGAGVVAQSGVSPSASSGKIRPKRRNAVFAC